MTQPLYIGMDFGTTNSAVGVTEAGGGAARILEMGTAAKASDTLRSLLAFTGRRRDAAKRPLPWVGQEAIDAYLETDEDCRLLQSFKSYLTSRTFTSASVLNSSFSLEDLIALVVGHLRQAAEAQGGAAVRKVVAGRPVRFVAEDGKAEEDFALDRLRIAFGKAGIDEVLFEYEPIAAAYYYESTLARDEIVLVADFGGGTSDFCLVHLGPGRKKLSRSEEAIIGTAGVGIAGDTFDRRIVEHGLSDHFGRGVTFRSDHKSLPMPAWIYGKVARWHHIGFLNTSANLRMLKDIQKTADDPDLVENLLILIEHHLGYHLYRAVEKAKLALSRNESTQVTFQYDPIDIDMTVTRSDFESWIAPELAEIEGCVDGLLASTGISAAQVDRVFMTGGSSLVPAVRNIFTRRFGEDKISAGGEFISVAGGLAYRAREAFGEG